MHSLVFLCMSRQEEPELITWLAPTMRVMCHVGLLLHVPILLMRRWGEPAMQGKSWCGAS